MKRDLFVLLLAALVLVGCGHAQKKDPQRYKAATTTEAEIEDGWQKYGNEKYGFELSYPNEWQVWEVEYKSTAYDHRESMKVTVSGCGNPDALDYYECDEQVEITVHVPTAHFGPHGVVNRECGEVAAVSAFDDQDLQTCRRKFWDDFSDKYYIRTDLNFYTIQVYLNEDEMTEDGRVPVSAITTRVLESFRFLPVDRSFYEATSWWSMDGVSRTHR